ncbi:MAG TPA: cation:proton antiporter [Candidatus Dormibacteraeota bacterium]|nr:cation:proton antiporter [Candidatus Dormibacteraeota bacterium]
MPPLSFEGLLGVALIAFGAPLLLGLAPRLRVPAVVLEIIAGIVVGPSVLGWIHVDLPIAVLSTLGLTFLLFLAGMEVDFDRLRGRPLRLAAAGLLLSFVLALAAGYASLFLGLVRSPVFLAIILVATSLGLVLPVLKDAGLTGGSFGQVVIASASLADFGAVIVMSLLFSREARSPFTTALLLVGFTLTIGVAAFTIARAERLSTLSMVLRRLQDTTAQIRVRGAVLLLLALAALAGRFGIELLLASFMAGSVIALIDRDGQMTHPQFHSKLQAVGYGFLIPIFFVTSGLQFDLKSLLASAAGIVKIPVFLAALLIVRGLPAALYARDFGRRQAAVAGLLQATSLPFIVAATQIGIALNLLQPSTAAALVAAGLLSVVVFPAAALAVATPPRRGEVMPAAQEERW